MEGISTRHRMHAAALIVDVAGELDLATSPQVESFVEQQDCPTPCHRVLNLTDVSFLDSSGCRLIAGLAKRALSEGSRFSVVCPRANSTVYRVLDMVGLTDAVPMLETVPE